MTTVLIAGGGTGGHLMPALAIGRALGERHPEWRIVHAGAERGIEAQLLPARGVPHHLLPSEPLYRRQWWRNFRWPLLLVPLLRRVDAMLGAERPDAVVGTGGYASGPVLWRAAARGIPTGILDLDVRPGFTTRWLARRVREIWVAAPEAVAQLPAAARARTVVTGAPIVPPDPSRRDAARAKFGLRSDQAVLLVTGGSQGSLAINRQVDAWLSDGGEPGVQLLWVTGRGTHQQFAHHHAPPAVTVIPFLDPMADAWAVADLVVSRCGMSTLSEICAWGLPSILIPLPTSAADHQTHNARAMEAAGAATVLLEPDLEPGRFGREVATLMGSPERRKRMAAAARARGRPEAVAAIVTRIEGLVGTPPPA